MVWNCRWLKQLVKLKKNKNITKKKKKGIPSTVPIYFLQKTKQKKSQGQVIKIIILYMNALFVSPNHMAPRSDPTSLQVSISCSLLIWLEALAKVWWRLQRTARQMGRIQYPTVLGSALVQEYRKRNTWR